MKTKLLFFILLCWLIHFETNSQDFSQVYKAVASDRAEEDYFGQPVSISGNYAIIGAAREDEDAEGENTLDNAGSVYFFERGDSGTWHEVQKIVASDRAVEDRFGSAISISGNYAIAGAWFEDEDTSGGNTMDEAGSAYIFKRDGYGKWSEVQKIIASDRTIGDHFGRSVSISGSMIIVGATQEDEDTSGNNTFSDAGSAYIFKMDESGIWHEIQKIVASDRNVDDHFGLSVDISDKYIVVGARDEDEDVLGENTVDGAGSAYIFECDQNGNWFEVQKVAAPFRGLADQFGVSVCVSDNYIGIGACTEDENASEEDSLANAGSTYIFEREVNGSWSLAQKIIASDREGEEYFGNEVCISGNRMIIGAHYEDNNALGEDSLEYAGAAYIFTRNSNNEWVETQKIVASDRDVFDFFGYSVSISGDYVIAGARTECEDANGENTLEYAGSAYFFESCVPVPCCEMDSENILENGHFDECVLSPWSVYNADNLGVTADAILTGGECTVTNISLAEEPNIYHVQLQQVFSTTQVDRLVEGATYEFTFDAWSETENRPCRVSLEQNVDPWANIFNQNIELSATGTSYTYEFTVNQLFANMQLTFQLGSETGSASFDNVRLVKKAVEDTPNDIYFKIEVMPNPTSEFILIEAPESSEITIYNCQGLIVMKTPMTHSQVRLDVNGLVNGIYLVAINTGHRIIMEKIIIK
jgi:hypothetical protein